MDLSPSSHENEPWIQLTEKKQFSRLLYTNPVCFLSTFAAGDSSSSPGRRNVMVLSWLTATSNEGTFMCSINRRRHTASVLCSGVVSEFVLSVPVMGMETLVRDVGRVSGRWGSKFPQDHNEQEVQQQADACEEHISKRQAKKRSRMSLTALGIPGLDAVPFGNQLRTHATHQLDARLQPFAIQGTVAHLNCSIYKRLDNLIDDDHLLILGKVTAAYVNPSYWDSTRNLFHPDLEKPPYLTFLGSQEFGYAVTQATY